jgi:paraquat-inducible protein B
MSSNQQDELPQPLIRPHGPPSLIWIVPIVTLLIGGWLVYNTLAERGERIAIHFKTAEGIEAGKTRVRYKSIDIGTVRTIHFDQGFERVVLQIDMVREATPFLRSGSRFWVVKPRLGLRGVTGLSTLISGAYIELEPGEGEMVNEFVGLESPPVVDAGESGLRLRLSAPNLGSIDIGSPIYYLGIGVGEVLGYELNEADNGVVIHAFIRSPYDRLVRAESHFWNVSGVALSLGAEGVRLQTESLASMVYGGIAFETPAGATPSGVDLSRRLFRLYQDYDQIGESRFVDKIRFVLFFEGSVRGLAIGAPVEFRGIKVGSVVDVRMEFDRQSSTFRIPVTIEVEPERVVERDPLAAPPLTQTIALLVERGLRARLETGNLLTGQLYVDLDMRPDTPVRLVAGESADLPELPTIAAEFDEIAGSVRGLLTRLERVDIEGIGGELKETLSGANALVHSAELAASLRSLATLLRTLEQGSEPVVETLGETLSEAKGALEQIGQVLDIDSPAQYGFNQMTGELGEMARSIRSLVDLLERDPQSLLFGKRGAGESR